MKKSRFSEEQMVKILRETDKQSVAQLAEKHGVSEQTIYAWHKRFGKLEAVDVKRLRQLEQENAKLKKLVAERDLGSHLISRTHLEGPILVPEACHGEEKEVFRRVQA